MFSQKLIGPWSFRSGILVLLAFVVGYYALSGLHMWIVKNTVGFDAYLGDSGVIPVKVLLISQISKAFVILIVLYTLALKRHQLDWKALGFRSTTRGWIVGVVIISVAGFVLLFLLNQWIVSSVPGWLKFAKPPVIWNSIGSLELSVFLFVTVIVTPIAEEMFFRGFLFQWMCTRRPVWLAALVSSLMFGVSHIVPAQMIAATLMSFAIIYLYVASRSIWPAIVCHIANNALSSLGNLLASGNLLPDFMMPPGV